MNLHERYYMENLYPFQDGVLNIVKRLPIPCYLTGGTALSRGYFQHRYSDDLDLFVNQQAHYADYVQILFSQLEADQSTTHFSLDYQRLRRYENFTQFFLIKQDDQHHVELKIDFVNDVAAHYGNFIQHAHLGLIDSWQNMLSNKLSAIFRFEAKDIVDIWIIASRYPFSWISIIKEAKTKEAGIDPIVLCEILTSFPEDALETIKWIVPVDGSVLKRNVEQIARDILHGNDNSLAGFYG